MGSGTWIVKFLQDERGTESVEFGIVGVVVSCGSVRGMLAVQAAVDTKVAAAVEEINLAQ